MRLIQKATTSGFTTPPATTVGSATTTTGGGLSGFLQGIGSYLVAPARRAAGLGWETSRAIGISTPSGRDMLRRLQEKKMRGEQLNPLEELFEKSMLSENPLWTKEEAAKYGSPDVATRFGMGFKTGAGLGSYLVPAGVGLKGALAGGATIGGMREFAEPETTTERVTGAAAGGAIAGGAFYGAGKVLGKGKEFLGKVGKRGAAGYTKASPTDYVEALTEHGIDLRALQQKYVPIGTSYDDMLGGTAERGRGGILGSTMKEAENTIQQTAKAAGENIRISGDAVLNALKREQELMQSRIGEETKRKALNKIVEEATKKYANGITVKEALTTLRHANQKFGRAVLETEKGAVVTSAQKLEANTLRTVLKEMFPEIAEALRTEEEILVLQPLLNTARAKGSVKGFNLNAFDISRPLTLFDVILNQPKVASFLAQIKPKVGVPTTTQLTGQKLAAFLGGAVGGGIEPTTTPPPTTEPVGLTPTTMLPTTAQLPAKTAQPLISREMMGQLMLADLLETGGKNMSKIQALYEAFQPEKTELTALREKREMQIADTTSMVNEIEQQMNLIQTGRITGLGGKIGAAFGISPEITQYEALRRASIGPMARAISSEAGVLTDQDIARAESLLPRVTDTEEEVRRKIAQLRGILAKKARF